MISRAEFVLPVDLQGEVELLPEGLGPVTLRGDGSRVVAELQGWGQLGALRSQIAPASPAGRGLGALLDRLDLDFDVVLHGQVVAHRPAGSGGGQPRPRLTGLARAVVGGLRPR